MKITQPARIVAAATLAQNMLPTIAAPTISNHIVTMLAWRGRQSTPSQGRSGMESRPTQHSGEVCNAAREPISLAGETLEGAVSRIGLGLSLGAVPRCLGHGVGHMSSHYW
jgi:hypothetical protein